MGNSQLPKTLSDSELLNECRRWEHEINKMNIGVARNFASMMSIELSDSQTAADLIREINWFYMQPDTLRKNRMRELATQLVIEQQKKTAGQGA